jgi:hypothetical protein
LNGWAQIIDDEFLSPYNKHEQFGSGEHTGSPLRAGSLRIFAPSLRTLRLKISLAIK